VSHLRLLAVVGLAVLGLMAGVATVAARSTAATAELPALFVHVNDAASGRPVAGADVVVTFVGGDPNHPVVTGTFWDGAANGGGFVLFKGIEPGVEVISVSAEGYVPFGDSPRGRLPTGRTVVYTAQAGVHVSIDLTALAPCRTCPPHA